LYPIEKNKNIKSNYKIYLNQMKKLTIIFLIFFLLPIASAGTISLTTTISSEFMMTNTTQIHVKTSNSGDEPAYNVQITLISDNFQTEPFYIGTLTPNIPSNTSLTIKTIGNTLPGNYPLVLMTEYQDANGYQFSSVSPFILTYKTHVSSTVSGTIHEIELSGQGEKNLLVYLKNTGDVSKKIKLKLILPRELKAENTENELWIGAKEEKEINAKISNFAGLEGSSYAVLSLIEYEEKGAHYSSVANGIVKIVEKRSLNMPEWLPITAVVILSIIFIIYQSKNKLIIKSSKK